MGLVYRVRHRGWNIDLAMKSPRPNFFKTEAQKENFVRECETWVGLGLHPNIVSCYYVRSVADVPRVFAEYVQGGTLKEWINTRKLYEGEPEAALKRVLSIAIQMAWGLHYTHERGVIHQDVKPANVLMTPEGTAKITDFGLAKARLGAGETVATSKTRSVLVSGGGMTPAYGSPEQLRKEPLTRRTDVWSWGLSVVEMFAGHVFWKKGSAAPAVLRRLVKAWTDDAAPPPLREELAQLLKSCFEESPGKRRSDLLAIAEELKTIYRALTGQDFPLQNAEGAELADGLNNRGVSFWDLGKALEAEQAFEQALELQPEHPQATFNQNLLRWRNAQATDTEFIAALEELRDHRQRDWVPRYLLGLAHLLRHDAPAALSVLTNAAQLQGGFEVSQALDEARKMAGAAAGARGFEGHADWVKSVALSSDGQRVLSGSADRTVRLWDAATGRCLHVFQGHTHWVNSVALSGDGRWALSGAGDNSVRLWNALSGQYVRSFVGHTDWVNGVALTSDGRWALSGSADKTVRLWDCATGKCLQVLLGHTEWVNTVAISADGHWGLSAGLERELRLWDLSATILAACVLASESPGWCCGDGTPKHPVNTRVCRATRAASIPSP